MHTQKFQQNWSVSISDPERAISTKSYNYSGAAVASPDGKQYYPIVATGYGASPTEAAKDASAKLRLAEDASLKQAALSGNTAAQIEKLLQIHP